MRIQIGPQVVHSEVSGETVILNLSTGTYFGLDEIGTLMWNLLAQHGSTDSMIRTLLDEYEVGDEKLRADIDELLSSLKAHGLVTTHD